MSYYLLTTQYPEQFIHGSVSFVPELSGYYQNCNGRLPENTVVTVRMDVYVRKVKEDFFTIGGAVFVSQEFCDILERYNANVQLLPAQLYYFRGKALEKQYYLLHSLQNLDCFDYGESDYGGKSLVLKYLAQEGRPRKLIRSIRRLCIDQVKVQEQDYFFVEHILSMYPVISERLMKALETAQLVISLVLADEIDKV